ncbi:TPA_asm: maturation protein [ssRNA phage SRR7976301_1]|uniref:Maturation protein n=1 Tax=ssRNA phage SRR7976301_1 TaxID=2786659 RepID=A0A8S5L0G0_9VIRU|nr:maturation protein [ssRNA phage SRR7976301_1]DAD51121.1 TPA_asm: maturation protein [ssRNA phage SRR7976301_1]
MSNKQKLYYKTYSDTSVGVSFGGSPPVDSTVELITGFTRIADDVPGYKDKIKKGLPATGNMSVEVSETKYKKGRVNFLGVHDAVLNQVGYSGWCGLEPVVKPTPVYNSRLMLEAVNDATIGIMKKIRAQQQFFSGPTFLGEFRDVVHGIRHPAEALRGLSNDLIRRTSRHKGKAKLSRRDLRDLGSTWLEYSFGVVPLLNDIGDIARASLDTQEAQLARVRYSSKKEDSYSDVFTNGVPGYVGNIHFNHNCVERATCTFVAGVMGEATLPLTPLERVARLSGFNMSEVLPTAWELIPWSFLVDYFSNIGDVISAATTSTANVAWWSRTTSHEVKHDYSQAWVEDTDPNWVVGIMVKSPMMLNTNKLILRDGAAPEIPSVTFSLPGKSNQFKNMAALIAQAL